MNRFLGACGATGPLRLAAERPRVFGPVSVALDKPFALVGSGVHADLRLDDNQVSHRHLYVQVYNGRVFGIDLGSRTGTHWDNGNQPFGWLDPGKSVWIGRHRVYLEGDSPGKGPASELPQEPLLSRDFNPGNLPPVSLEFVKGGIQKEGRLKPARFAVNRVLVLMGRTEGCKIRLMDSSVSKYHCSLIRTPRGVWVVDLLSRNGIWVNGANVPWARLEQGDRLEIGAFVLRLHYDEPEDEQRKPDADPNPSGDPIGPPPVISDSDPDRSVGSQPYPPDDPEPPRESSLQASSDVDRPSQNQSVSVLVEETAPEDPNHALVVSPRRSLIPVELSESIAVVIANQFSQMQQQLFDQFYQAMLVMFQTFSTLHKDQMDLVRQELDRVHDLTRQLQALKTELAKHPAAEKDPEVQRLLDETQALTPAPSVDPRRAFKPDGWNEAFREAAQKVMAANLAAQTQPEPNLSPSSAQKVDLKGRTLATKAFVVSSEPTFSQPTDEAKTSKASVSPIDEKSGLSASRAKTAEPSSSEQIPPVAADIHAMLSQKIAAIQAERQSRWQKIIGFLAGKQSGEAVP